MSDFSDGPAREKVGNGQPKTEIRPWNLLGAIDANLGDRRSHYVRVGIGQRDGIPVIVLRITPMGIPIVRVMMRILMISDDMMIVMMINFQHVHPGIVMESPRPDHKGQSGEASHQETVLTNEHSSQSRWRGSKVKGSKVQHPTRGSTTRLRLKHSPLAIRSGNSLP